MNILVINAGSSSLKYKLFHMEDTGVMAGGSIERIGEVLSSWTHYTGSGDPKKTQLREQRIGSHQQGLHLVVTALLDAEAGVLKDITEIDATGHRVVQGGETFGAATLIDDAVKQAIRDHSPLAPLHNPANLSGIEVAEVLLPGIPNIAVFDTEFHQTMPSKAFLYALPHEYYSRYKVRRYGFHGTSHRYVAHEAARLMDKNIHDINLITIHLGNGCSISAVEKGICKDTSMGMTPLAGIMMGTRTGDMDPAIIKYLMAETGMDIDTLDGILNKESGFKGICGLNDMRDIHDAHAGGSHKAGLAIDMFCYRIKKYIGAYTAVLGHVDAIIFTAGIGENDAMVRATSLENLSGFGIQMDHYKNDTKPLKPFSLHLPESRVQIWVIPTNEELQIAMETRKVLENF